MPILTSDERIRFDRWFTAVFAALRQLPDGDGALVALSTALYLYERYAAAKLDAGGHKADRASKLSQLAADFGISPDEAETFWNVFRNGLLHQGMPVQLQGGAPLPKWLIAEGYSRTIELTTDTPPVLRVEPWKFVQRVVELWHGDISLLSANKSFPLAEIHLTPPGSSTGSPAHNPGGWISPGGIS